MPAALDGVGELDQPFGRIGAPVEQHVLDALEQVLRDVFVDHELPGIDDAHVHARLDRVIEERRVHRFAHHVVAAEREREVADAATHVYARTPRPDDACRLDEVAGVVVVLLDAGRDREDVRIEDDVGRIDAGRPGQQAVGALADRHLALDRIRLPLLVEGHHDHRRAVALDGRRLLQEILLAFLQADRVDDALALQALQTGLDDRPLRAVHHHRDAGDLGLGRNQVEERRHRLLGVEHALVHVDVQEVGAAADLIDGDLDRAAEVAAPE